MFLVPGSLTAPNSQYSTVSHPQQFMLPNSSINNLDTKLFSRAAENTSDQRQLSKEPKTQRSREVNQHSVDLRIEEAKQALRDLHSQGFGFDQIVKEGLNPDVLRKLYDEIKVPFIASSGLGLRNGVKNGIVDVHIESAPSIGVGIAKDQHPRASQKDSNGVIFDDDKSTYLSTGEIKTSSQSANSAMKTEDQFKPMQAGIAKSAVSSKANPLGKASNFRAGERKTLDRKDYIARMLAAKTGKPIVNASTAASPETLVASGSGISAQVQSAAATGVIVPTTVQHAPNELLNTPSGTQNEDLDAEAKRKAQTDLARQKIEALKFRENFSHQDPSATSSDIKKTNQKTTTNGVPNIVAKISASTPRPFPSRQSSYFSPASQKPPFSIPGLFMTSDAPEPANSSQPLVNELFALPSLGVGSSTSGSSQEDLRPQATISVQSPTADTTSSLPKNSSDSDPKSLVTKSAMFASSRERQKASNFTDSPSTRVKRPLGQQGENSVIIDISDDDDSTNSINHSGDEHPSTEELIHPGGSLQKKSHAATPGNGTENPTRSVPALNEFLQRKKAVAKTPPATQVSGQSGDLKDLKSKEMEIEAINRKIAELEQRIAIKAKQTTSRNHSPGTSSRVTASPPLGEASQQITGAMKMPLDDPDSLNDDVGHVANSDEISAADQLDAKQQLEMIERTKAEVEHSLAAEISLTSAASQSLVQEEKLQTLQAEEGLNQRIGEQRPKDEMQKQAHDGGERHFVEMRGQKACEKTAKFEEADSNLHTQERRLAQGMQQEHSQEQEQKRFFEDQRQARKSEIESGLPLLNAEVEKTRERLELLRHEVAGLETQLQKGMEGRQALVEELNSLMQSREIMPEPMEIGSCDISDIPKQSTSSKIFPGK